MRDTCLNLDQQLHQSYINIERQKPWFHHLEIKLKIKGKIKFKETLRARCRDVNKTNTE